MKHHMVWAILAVITFAGHKVAGMYADYIWFLPEYIWFISVGLSVIAIYSGSRTAGVAREERRGLAVASVLIAAVVLLSLLISAAGCLFVPDGLIAGLMARGM
jgi:hypothetical protein